ncbi:MAG: 16S rRNA (guanine(527)-N(7))-methyltransferase RsmG [Desulfobacterales bacterium]|nr:16S rRNA (guanine(527)-N(7))-methyltransferase RsmG [Desulfobacterales bacterium]
MNRTFDLSVFETRLKAGAEILGITLTDEQTGAMACHARELWAWNKKINLTAITDPLASAEKHFVDALAVLPFLGNETRIMDMGSGGGFPAIPLKILAPSVSFTMVDSVRKKVNFMNHVARQLKLEGIKAVHSRVEELAKSPDHACTYDAVISRGFTGLEAFADLALPMLTQGGCIYALKGKQALEEVTPGLQERFYITHDHYLLPFEKSDRYLIKLISK